MPETTPQIPVARPWLGDAEVEAAARVIRSGWITQGPECAAFEQDLAAYLQAPHACVVSNCTTALHLALLVAGVGPGDEVVTVSHSFIATANSILACGARPVFVDIDPSTFNIDPQLVRQAVGPKTRAILCVHQLGMPCDLQQIVEVGQAVGLPVIEDAACAIGSEILWNGQWEKIGKPHGDVACFSFHPRKILSTGDGGLLTTRRPEWDRQFRLRRQHGMSVPDTVRHSSREVIFETYTVPGFNYRMTDIQAAVGREQLKRVPEMVARRRELVEHYCRLLADIPGLLLPHEPNWARSNWQSFAVRIAQSAYQREVMQSLLHAGISTRRGVMCAHREAAYPTGAWRCGGCPEDAMRDCQHLKESEMAQDEVIILPLYHQMTEAEQCRVVTALANALDSASRRAA